MVQFNPRVFSRMQRAVRRRLAFLLAGNLLLLALIFALLKPGSSFADVLTRLPGDIAPPTLVGFALTGIVFTGAIDLSVASIIALSGTAFGALVNHGAGPFTAFAGCAAAAWALMTVNGVLIARTGLPAIIVTLAGLPFYRGLALILADMAVSNFSGNISVTEELYHAPGKSYPGAILSIGIVAALVLECSGKSPRIWLALGNSAEACNLLGVDPRAILRGAFRAGGVFLAAGALVYVTRVQEVEPARMALGFELQAIAAVILGGTNIFGGEGSYLGTLLGALFLYLVSQMLVYAGASAYLQDAISGAVILAIIAVDCALHRRAKLMEELA